MRLALVALALLLTGCGSSSITCEMRGGPSCLCTEDGPGELDACPANLECCIDYGSACLCSLNDACDFSNPQLMGGTIVAACPVQ